MSIRELWGRVGRGPATAILAPVLAAVLLAGGCRGKGQDQRFRLPAAVQDRAPAIVLREDIFVSAPFNQCHASTIVETASGFVAAWFGGTAEGSPDVGIWLSRRAGSTWSPPVEVASGRREAGGSGSQPCWNPVLFYPEGGPLLLFYKVGPSPLRWHGMLMSSTDDGRTWTEPRSLPNGILGPVKNHPLEFADGTILCGSSTEDNGWRVHFEMTKDKGLTWRKTPPISDGREFGLIQPALLRAGADGVVALMRSTAGRIYFARSADRGETWSAPQPLELANPNSGLDAVTLGDGRHIVVFNPVSEGRTPLAVALSQDGLNWKQVLTLEDEKGAEFSYPAVIQSSDGLVHITYTWKRLRIRHVVLDPGLASANSRT